MDPHDRGRRHARSVVPAPLRLDAARLRLVEPRCVRRSSAACCASGSIAASTASASMWRTASMKADGLPDYTPPADAALDGRRRGRRALLGPGQRARGVPRLAQGRSPSTTATARCAPRRGSPRSRRRRSGCAPTRCTRRSTSPTSRPAWDAAALRAVIDDSIRAYAGRRRAEHVGALEPRRRAARLAARADRREPPGPRHRPGLSGQADRRRRPSPRPRRDDASCSPCPAPRTSTRARSSACPRSSTCRTTRARIRRGSARRASATGVTDAACRCPWTAEGAALRIQRHRRLVAAAAGRVGDVRPRRAGRRPGVDPEPLHAHCSAARALRARRTGRSSGSTGYGADVVAFRRGRCMSWRTSADARSPWARGHRDRAQSEPFAATACPPTRGLVRARQSLIRRAPLERPRKQRHRGQHR